jgi:hypothetical protein
MPLVDSLLKLKSTPEVGVWIKDEMGLTAVIHSTRFDEMFPDSSTARNALIWLDDKGRLQKSNPANLATTDNKKWAERVVKIDGGSRKFRAIMFHWPRNNAAPSKK